MPNVILEVEVGVGGEEDGLDARGVADERLYSTPADAVAVVERLGSGEQGRYLLDGREPRRYRLLGRRSAERGTR